MIVIITPLKLMFEMLNYNSTIHTNRYMKNN